jgi:hypothetical protein
VPKYRVAPRSSAVFPLGLWKGSTRVQVICFSLPFASIAIRSMSALAFRSTALSATWIELVSLLWSGKVIVIAVFAGLFLSCLMSVMIPCFVAVFPFALCAVITFLCNRHFGLREVASVLISVPVVSCSPFLVMNKAYQRGAFGHFPVLDQKIEIIQKNVAMTNSCTAPANEVAQQSALVCVESTGCTI